MRQFSTTIKGADESHCDGAGLRLGYGRFSLMRQVTVVEKSIITYHELDDGQLHVFRLELIVDRTGQLAELSIIDFFGISNFEIHHLLASDAAAPTGGCFWNVIQSGSQVR